MCWQCLVTSMSSVATVALSVTVISDVLTAITSVSRRPQQLLAAEQLLLRRGGWEGSSLLVVHTSRPPAPSCSRWLGRLLAARGGHVLHVPRQRMARYSCLIRSRPVRTQSATASPSPVSAQSVAAYLARRASRARRRPPPPPSTPPAPQ